MLTLIITTHGIIVQDYLLVLGLTGAGDTWDMVGVTHRMAGVIHRVVGDTHHMVGDTLITQVVIGQVTGMDIMMAFIGAAAKVDIMALHPTIMAIEHHEAAQTLLTMAAEVQLVILQDPVNHQRLFRDQSEQPLLINR